MHLRGHARHTCACAALTSSASADTLVSAELVACSLTYPVIYQASMKQAPPPALTHSLCNLQAHDQAQPIPPLPQLQTSTAPSAPQQRPQQGTASSADPQPEYSFGVDLSDYLTSRAALSPVPGEVEGPTSQPRSSRAPSQPLQPPQRAASHSGLTSQSTSPRQTSSDRSAQPTPDPPAIASQPAQAPSHPAQPRQPPTSSAQSSLPPIPPAATSRPSPEPAATHASSIPPNRAPVASNPTPAPWQLSSQLPTHLQLPAQLPQHPAQLHAGLQHALAYGHPASGTPQPMLQPASSSARLLMSPARVLPNLQWQLAQMPAMPPATVQLGPSSISAAIAQHANLVISMPTAAPAPAAIASAAVQSIPQLPAAKQPQRRGRQRTVRHSSDESEAESDVSSEASPEPDCKSEASSVSDADSQPSSESPGPSGLAAWHPSTSKRKQRSAAPLSRPASSQWPAPGAASYHVWQQWTAQPCIFLDALLLPGSLIAFTH